MKPQSSSRKSPAKAPAEQVVKDIRRQTRRHFSAEDKIRIVLDGLRGEDSIAELCRKEGIAQSLYYTWSKEFMEAGSAAWPVTPPAPRPAARCRICAARPAP
jgi:transposase